MCMYMYIAVICTTAEMVGLRDVCSDKNCTVGQYSTYDHVQGDAGRVEGSSEGSWQPSNCALEETWRYAYFN